MKTQINEIIKLIDSRELDKADSKLQELLTRKTRSSELLYIKAIIEKEKANYEAVEEYLLKVLRYDPSNYSAKAELIANYVALKKNTEAIKEAEKFLLKRPKDTHVLLSLASAYAKLREMDKAEDSLKQIIRLEPKNFLALYLLSISYYDQKKYAESVNTAIEALGINPQLDYMRTIIADHYAEREDHFLIAINLLNEEIKINPNSDCAYRMLGSCFAKIGQIDKCLEYTKKQIEINPNCPTSRNNYLLFSHYSPNVSSEEILQAANDFYKFCFHKYNDKKHYDHSNRTKNNTLKIGFVSGDLRNHALFFWLREFFKELRNYDLETYYFCNNNEDEYSSEVKTSATHWLNIEDMNDKEVCDYIYNENIDILFDLSGHTAKNRLEVFMSKPAPLQITWLGQSGPLGIPEIDYMLTDPYLVRDCEVKDYTEGILKMPNSFAPYGDFTQDLSINEAPCIKNGYVTFGCFNNFIKINPEVLEAWIKILTQVKDSHLILKSHLFIDSEVTNRYLMFFEKNGIPQERIRLEAFNKDRTAYLKLYNEVDIALDPFPLGGGTTTHDLLYMGTPLIATCGKRMSHRIAASLLNLIGCKELIARDKEEYIKIAVELAEDPKRINSYKNQLREKYLNSTIADNKQFTADFITLCNSVMEKHRID